MKKMVIRGVFGARFFKKLKCKDYACRNGDWHSLSEKLPVKTVTGSKALYIV